MDAADKGLSPPAETATAPTAAASARGARHERALAAAVANAAIEQSAQRDGGGCPFRCLGYGTERRGGHRPPALGRTGGRAGCAGADHYIPFLSQAQSTGGGGGCGCNRSGTSSGNSDGGSSGGSSGWDTGGHDCGISVDQ
ncbi:hypothetical protein I4F81_005710 [Pyropia yezoensis]|uniref:Uncharacterized protein n=1 Tax=Pyropia yezoensis TaxID=2788 RepID=A0ACC3C036_PYRYE|nr:hypothetical protein I4F81_005710 [Neopyropia yezoensis]